MAERVNDPRYQHRLMLALRDRTRVRGDDLRVLVALNGWLSTDEYLPVRPSALAREVYRDPVSTVVADRAKERWQEVNIARSLDRLVGFGYLGAGPRDPRSGDRTFRLSMPPLCSTGASTQAA